MTQFPIPAHHRFAAITALAVALLSTSSWTPTEGQDKWSAYMDATGKKVRKQWLVRQMDKTGHPTVSWRIHRDGTISDVTIKKSSYDKTADSAALAAVKAAIPFDPLPNPRAEFVEIDFDFDNDTAKRTSLGLTVRQALKKYGKEGREQITRKFTQAGVAYPPTETTWVCLKEEKLILVFAKDASGKWKQVAYCPFVDASGGPGPKLAEGDMQVPEGFYRPTKLDASTHLCLWLDYPNNLDLSNARTDKRTNLGGDIQIHEGICSSGCIVINHDDMSQLFVLANDVSCRNVKLLIAPCNMLAKDPPLDFARQPKWLPKLYDDLKKAMAVFPIDTATSAGSAPRSVSQD